MTGVKKRAAFAAVVGSFALVLAAIDGNVFADHGVIKKSDRLVPVITVACSDHQMSDIARPCDDLGSSSGAGVLSGLYITHAVKAGSNATTLIKTKLNK